MKQPETVFGMKKRYFVIMLLCFLYAGFSLFLLTLQSYSVFWRGEPASIALVRFPPDQNNGVDQNVFADAFRGTDRFSREFNRDPLAGLFSPGSMANLLGGVISILAGLSLWSITREKEIKKIKQETAHNLLLPDEKAVIETLKKNQFEATQSYLSKQTGLSKVQIHRVLHRLETKGVLEKHKFGLTNKVLLKRELFD